MLLNKLCASYDLFIVTVCWCDRENVLAKKGKRLRLRLIQGFTFFLMKSMVIDVVIRGTVVVELDPVPDLGSRRHDSGRG